MTESHHHHGHHSSEHTGGHSPAHSHGHSPEDEERMATMLDLDASVLADHLAEVTDWVANLAGAPQKIADLGSGTGTGTRALAQRFETATIYAVDSAESMLERLGRKMAENGLADRVVQVHADLDNQWPELKELDLIWAASSMHHVANPSKTFADTFGALTPGGMFAVVEMDGFPHYLPENLGFGEPGLETRIRAVIDNRGWNKYPDWEPQLVAAGFEVQQREFTYDYAPDPSVVGPYAHVMLANVRAGLADQLSAEDLATIDALLDQHNPEALINRTDLQLRGGRTVWAARRP